MALALALCLSALTGTPAWAQRGLYEPLPASSTSPEILTTTDPDGNALLDQGGPAVTGRSVSAPDCW